LAVFALTVGIVSVLFLKKSDYWSGGLVLLVTIVVQSITACVWKGNVGILFIYLIGRILINFLSVIPGLILTMNELRTDKKRHH